jgi:DNA-directed RNA polymerase I, II, and III subunit RPABC1
MFRNNSPIYRSRKVILDMVERRGYDTGDYQHFTIEDINTMMNLWTSTKTAQKYTVTPLDMVCKHKEEEKYLHVRYFFNAKLKVNTVENILNTMIEEEQFNTEEDEVLCIVDEKISNEAMFDNQLDGLFKKMDNKYYTQIFEISKLIINIMEHEFVPEHTIISKEEKQKLLERFDIATFTQLPIILKSDPVAKFIGMRRGDVCKIIRPSETSGRYEMYRYCQ